MPAAAAATRVRVNLQQYSNTGARARVSIVRACVRAARKSGNDRHSLMLSLAIWLHLPLFLLSLSPTPASATAAAAAAAAIARAHLANIIAVLQMAESIFMKVSLAVDRRWSSE